MSNLIGPLTAEEWCEFRLRPDEDHLLCCGVTSDFRDAIFDLLRMGGEDRQYRHSFRRAYYQMVDHGLPEGRSGELVARLVTYFLGEPPEPKQEMDDLSDEEVIEQMMAASQPLVSDSPPKEPRP